MVYLMFKTYQLTTIKLSSGNTKLIIVYICCISSINSFTNYFYSLSLLLYND